SGTCTGTPADDGRENFLRRNFPRQGFLRKNMAEKKSKSLWDAKIIRRALGDAVVKLDPRTMMKNPVMFVVEVGAVVTTVLLFRGKQSFAFNLQITLWLWF